jgi:hypothetical protein
MSQPEANTEREVREVLLLVHVTLIVNCCSWLLFLIPTSQQLSQPRIHQHSSATLEAAFLPQTRSYHRNLDLGPTVPRKARSKCRIAGLLFPPTCRTRCHQEEQPQASLSAPLQPPEPRLRTHKRTSPKERNEERKTERTFELIMVCRKRRLT